MQVSRKYGTGRVVTLSPAQWCNSVKLSLPFCALLAVSCPCSDSVNRHAVALKCIIQLK